jgi:hypothetical protein
MIEGRLHGTAGDVTARRREPLAQHLTPSIVAQERELGAAVEVGEALPQGDKGRVEVGRDAECVREGSESARGHVEGRGG